MCTIPLFHQHLCHSEVDATTVCTPQRSGKVNLDGEISSTLLFLRDFLKFRYTVRQLAWETALRALSGLRRATGTWTTRPLCRARREVAAPPGRGARDPVPLESETRTNSSHYSAEPRCRDYEIQSDRCVARYGHNVDRPHTVGSGTL